jgi:hypothetical protein
MLPRHARQYTPSSVPNPSLGPGVLDTPVSRCIDFSSGCPQQRLPRWRIRLVFVPAPSISDRQTDDMDVKPHVRAPGRLVAPQFVASQFVAFLHRSSAVLVADAYKTSFEPCTTCRRRNTCRSTTGATGCFGRGKECIGARTPSPSRGGQDGTGEDDARPLGAKYTAAGEAGISGRSQEWTRRG